MKIKRTELLTRLQKASVGLSRNEVLEQSNCFVFTDGKIVTFNEQIMAVVKSPIEIEAVVIANDFMKLLAKFPDEEIDVDIKGNELIIKGNKKKAGITCFAENLLLVDAVPKPKKWSKLAEDTMDMLKQAARCCGNDEQFFKMTVVHATPDLIESCDNARLFRSDMETGFPEEILIPGASILAIAKYKIKKVSVGEGWTHFKTKGGHKFSLNSSHEDYLENVGDILTINDGHEIKLPRNLGEIVGRADVMKDDGLDPQITVSISENKMKITSRKDTGWYRETKKIKYTGPSFEFLINPKFLLEMMKRTRTVVVNETKMKIEDKGIQFVTSLVLPQTPA